MLAIALVAVWRRWQRLPEKLDESYLLSMSHVRLLVVFLGFVFAARILLQSENQIKQWCEADNAITVDVQPGDGLQTEDNNSRMLGTCLLARVIQQVNELKLTAQNSPDEVQMTEIIRTDGNIRIQGIRLLRREYHRGDLIPVSIFWEKVRDSSDGYETLVQLRRITDNSVVYQTQRRPPGYYPTLLWEESRYIEDALRLPIPATLPGGEYVIDILLWRCTASGCDETANFLDPENRRLGMRLTIQAPLDIE
jgi:hypothetical protein